MFTLCLFSPKKAHESLIKGMHVYYMFTHRQPKIRHIYCNSSRLAHFTSSKFVCLSHPSATQQFEVVISERPSLLYYGLMRDAAPLSKFQLSCGRFDKIRVI